MNRVPRMPWAPTGKVSQSCEHHNEKGIACGQPAVVAYPAMGGGYCALCGEHGKKHSAYTVTIAQAKRGEFPRVSVPPEEKTP